MKPYDMNSIPNIFYRSWRLAVHMAQIEDDPFQKEAQSRLACLAQSQYMIASVLETMEEKKNGKND
jgi:hypothetical protein